MVGITQFYFGEARSRTNASACAHCRPCVGAAARQPPPGWGGRGRGILWTQVGAPRGLGVSVAQEAPSGRTPARRPRVSLRAPSHESSDAGTVFRHLRSEAFEAQIVPTSVFPERQ